MKKYIITWNSINEGYAYNIIEAKLDNNTTFTYYVNPKNTNEWGSELYIGKNYNVDSKKRSYSNNYKHWINMPKKYINIASDLMELHKIHFG